MRTGRAFRRAALAAVIALLVAGLPLSTVLAATGNTGAMSSVSCPTPTLCVAVEAAGHVATSTNPTGGAAAWDVAAISDNQLNAVSCASPSLCVAFDIEGNALISTNPTGGASAWESVSADGGSFVRAVSCPSTSLCVAVDSSGNVAYSTSPANTSSAWTVENVQPNGGLDAVSCSSESLCVTADDGSVVTSTNPDGGAWGAPEKIDGFLFISAMSCPSDTLCVAGDSNGRVFSSSDPGGGAWSQPVQIDTDANGGRIIRGISCAPGSTTCVGVDVTNAQADRGGNVVSTTNPSSGGAWSVASVDPHNMNAISCPSATLCVAVDTSGGVVTSTNPTGGAGAWHRVQLAFAPSNTKITKSVVDDTHNKAAFTFKSIGPFTGFQCALKKGKAKPSYSSCKSPRSYTGIHPGSYTFLVRSVNSEGPDPSPATKAFKIT